MIPIAKVVLGEEEKKAALEVMDSGWLSGGPKTEEFEQKFAKEVGADFAVAVCNGTIALDLSIHALGIKGTVAVPAVSFIATATSVIHNNCKPVFVDVKSNFNIDVDKIGKVKAAVPVALYGQSYDVEAMQYLVDKTDIKVVQDLAQAHGALFDDSRLGGFGNASCYSFYATKNITTGGEGGMITTNDNKLFKKLKMLVNQGQSEKYIHPVVGWNYRMTEIQAAIGIEQLKKLDKINEARINNSIALFKACNESNHIFAPVVDSRCKHIFHMFTCSTDLNRDEVVKKFRDRLVDARPIYPMPLYEQEAFKDFSNNVNCPNAKALTQKSFHLPVHQHLTVNDVEYICGEIREIGQ